MTSAGLSTTIIPWLAEAAMGFLLIVLLVRYFVAPFRGDVLPRLAGSISVKRRSRKPVPPKQVLIAVGAAFLVSRALILLAAAAATRGGVFVDPVGASVKWDAQHYLKLAEQWYVNEGDARLHLVFFPLYPLVVRGLYLLGMNSAAAGTLVSNLCTLGAAYALYRLAELDGGPNAGERAARLLLFSPLSFFFSIAYSESLFLMLTLLSVLAARRQRFALAVALGALAANARLLGLLTAVPIFYEYLIAVCRRGGGIGRAVGAFVRCLPVALGFVLYLCLNAHVSGDPFRFLTYQREHWSQQVGSLHNTLHYTLKNAFNYGDAALRWGTWIPQSLAILLPIALLAATYKKISPGDGAYALLYIYLAVSPTWLLSGSRYLTAMYAMYPMLTALTKRRGVETAVMIACCAATMAMVWLYMYGGVF